MERSGDAIGEKMPGFAVVLVLVVFVAGAEASFSGTSKDAAEQ